VSAPSEIPRRNVELKAIDELPDRSLERCLSLGASDHGELEQRDTYFEVSHGGLKLREQQGVPAHLIQFEREDEPQERESRYRLIDVNDGPALRAALTSALGVRVVVLKLRRLFIWQGVRIHLDNVQGLGTFIELEAVAAAQSDLAREHDLIRQLREVFAITDERLVAHGYATALLRQGGGASVGATQAPR
jgi:predicted adenylyl cyclase CyaB